MMNESVFSPNAVNKPKFDLKPEFCLHLNLMMAEDILNLFDACCAARITMPPHVWAMFKQLENWVGQEEEEDVSARKRSSIPR